MNAADTAKIIGGVTSPGFTFVQEVLGPPSFGTLVFAVFEAPCSKSGGELVLQQTRKWYIGTDQTESQIVQTCLKLVLTAIEHEARENFKYEGKAVFQPHHDVRTLQAVEDMVRDNSKSLLRPATAPGNWPPRPGRTHIPAGMA